MLQPFNKPVVKALGKINGRTVFSIDGVKIRAINQESALQTYADLGKPLKVKPKEHKLTLVSIRKK